MRPWRRGLGSSGPPTRILLQGCALAGRGMFHIRGWPPRRWRFGDRARGSQTSALMARKCAGYRRTSGGYAGGHGAGESFVPEANLQRIRDYVMDRGDLCGQAELTEATSLPSISTAQHTVKSPPKAPGPSPLPQEPGRSPSRSPPVQFGSPNSKGVSKGVCLGALRAGPP